MATKNLKEIRSIFKSYRILQKELQSRGEYIKDFSKILVEPLPKDEKHLKKIYNSIIEDMMNDSKKLRRLLKKMERALEKLDGPERSVMYHRYILGIPWVDMPQYVMYEQRSCQIYEKNAIKKISRMNINWEGNYDKSKKENVC